MNNEKKSPGINETNWYRSEVNRQLVSIAVTFVNYPSSFNADKDAFVNYLLLKHVF
jgi:hypothetical protein